jgi:signal transduction histidine kinase
MANGNRWIPKQVDQGVQERLLKLKRSIQGDLKKLVLDYRRMESHSRDLRQEVECAADDLQKTRSQLRSMQWDLRVRQNREAGLLNLLLAGLKEPLDIIEGHLDELAEQQGSDRPEEPLGGRTDRLRGEVRRLSQIVADLMAASTVQQGNVRLKQEKVDVRELVERVLVEHRQAARGHRVDLSGKFAGPIPLVLGDRRQLQLALNHLVDNAITHSPQGETVTVEANGKHTLDRVQVSVIDRRPDALDGQMMDVLWSPSPGRERLPGGVRGFDLELLAAAHIIDLLHGRIDVTSQPGKETVLTLTLPTGTMAERTP